MEKRVNRRLLLWLKMWRVQLMFRQEEVWVEVQGMKMWKVESMFRQGVVWGRSGVDQSGTLLPL